MKTKYLIISMVFIMSAILSGCGGGESQTLESYMDNNSKAKADIENTIAGMSDEDMMASVTFEGNTIIITETFNTVYSERIKKKMIKSFDEMSEDTFSEVIAQLEETTLIDGITMKVLLLNGDGELITEREYLGVTTG